MEKIKVRKTSFNLFAKVKWKPEKNETVVMVFLCAFIFSAAFFAGVEIMGNYDIAQSLPGGDVLAAENSSSETVLDGGGDIFPNGKKISEVVSGPENSVKNLAERTARARKTMRQQAANRVRILSGPTPTGPTAGLPDGRRMCKLKNDHPQGGGAVHVDEDCCPDYNETPNPRCAYSPGQMGVLRK